MTILIIPAESCQFRCAYCFEPDSVRKNPSPTELDIPAIERSLNLLLQTPQHEGSSLGLHGGEPLLVSHWELDALLKIQHVRSGSSSVQTNGYNINETIIKLFKKYNTFVGISCDGPEGLNILRGPNPQDKKITRGYNRKLKKTIRRLRKEDIPVSIICILHKKNASTPEQLETLKEWLLWLDDLGIVHGRLNPMFAAPWSKEYELTNEELIYAWTTLFDFCVEHDLKWNPLREMIDNILGFKVSPCIFCQCDYFSTTTLSILPDGTISNCDRTFQDGVHVRSTSQFKSGRYQALAQTQCKDCKYWTICGGVCPAEGIDGDWRNKSRFCEAIYATYEYIENRLRGLLPNIKLVTDGDGGEPFRMMSYTYSRSPSSYGGVQLTQPQSQSPVKVTNFQIVDPNHGDKPHGDGHGDKPHGDKPHGDSDRGGI